jgi:hypothetical protein
MTALVPRDPIVGIKFGTTLVDLSAFAVAVEITSEGETVDIGTFATPRATDTGKITDAITIAVLWSVDMYTALSAHVDEEGTLIFQPDADVPEAIQATVKYATIPWGRFEVGARVEGDLVLAVLSDITYAVPPAVLAADESAIAA